MMKTLISLLLVLGLSGTVLAAGGAKQQGMDKAMMKQMAEQSMQVFDLAEDVSIQDAIDSMMLRANNLNFKLVADLPLSE